MTGINTVRKCVKCGMTSKEDSSVTFHRFPLPSKHHGPLRATAWAKFCFPNDNCNSEEYLKKLHAQQKMLCGRHFDISSYMSTDRKKLNNFAIPTEAQIIFSQLREENSTLSGDINKLQLQKSAVPMEVLTGTNRCAEPIELLNKNVHSKMDNAGHSTSQSSSIKDVLVNSTDYDPMLPAGPHHDSLSQGESGLTESEKGKQCPMYERRVCVCCMATDHLEELFTEQRGVSGVHKYHAIMIQACFGVQVPETGGYDSICRSCIRKLHDAAEFKKQILKTMSVLMSVNVQQILPDLHDINALGVNEEFEDDANRKVGTIDELLNDAGETVNSGGDDSVSKADDEDMMLYCTYVDGDTWSSEVTEADTKQAMKQTPLPGRLRKYPKPNMPYTLDLKDTVCKECGQEFPKETRKKGLQKHTSGSFVCHVCGMEFEEFRRLETHKQLKHSQRPICRCSQCELRFSSKNVQLRRLKQMQRICDMKYQCSQCDMRFRLIEERSKHEVTHQKVGVGGCAFLRSRRWVEFSV